MPSDDLTPNYPKVHIVEEAMREGMQIESDDIPVEAKIELLDALSGTGLKSIVVGSFVSPKWTPQMARVEEIVKGFTPVEGVRYSALALNRRGVERMMEYVPPLSPPDTTPRTSVHVCDVFVRRNTNRSRQEEIDAWTGIVAGAKAQGAERAGIGLNAAWGSNWLGQFTLSQRMELLERQHSLWSEAGILVDRIRLGDPMGWNMPNVVFEQLMAVRERWPEIRRFQLHLHNARGVALVSAYEALRALDAECELVLDSSVGGMGGCPYGGHGRMTQMIPTEDLVDMLHELGIDTGVNLAKLIEAAHLAEEVVGHSLWGHVSKAGPRPRGADLFPMDLPFIETEEQAQHFRLGPKVYEGASSPWSEPIRSPYRSS
ncbi:MAG: citramalate synthase [Acidimicrobiales bacterium]